jgi:hypothetical protein
MSGQDGFSSIGASNLNESGGVHPNASTGTLGLAAGIFLGVNKSDSSGIAEQLKASGIVKSDQNVVSWSSGQPGRKWGDRIFKNAQEGVANASKGIEIGGSHTGTASGGGEGFSMPASFSGGAISNVSSGEAVVPISTPPSGGSAGGREL